jgi:uncharacterized membrane protein
MRRLTVRAKQQDGAISIMAAGLMLAMLLSTALAVDVGRVASVSRDQQGITDRAALDSVLVVGRSTAATLQGLYAEVVAAVEASIDRNPGSTRTAEQQEVTAVAIGVMQDGEFATVCDSDASCMGLDGMSDTWTRWDINAVWVATESVVPFMFAIGGPTDDLTGVVGRRVAKVSVAETLEVAGIMIGSRLASVNASALQDGLDALICSEHVADDPDACDVDFGTDIDTALLSYEGLMVLQVSLADLIEELGLNVGSVDEILTTSVTAVELLQATASLLGRDGHVAQAQVLNVIASEMSGSIEMTLGALLEFGTTNGQAVMRSHVNVFGLLVGTLQVANGDNLVALPDLQATIPGLLHSSADLSVISAPAQAFGPARQTADGWVTQARTAQAELDLRATLEGSNLDEVVIGIVSLLVDAANTLGLGLLSLDGEATVSDLEMPVQMAVAEGRTQLTDIRCRQDALPDVTELVDTGAVSVEVLDLDGGLVELIIPLRIQSLGLTIAEGTLVVTVHGDATSVALYSAGEGELVEFTDGDYPRGPQTVSSGTGLDGIDGGHLSISVDVSYSGSALIGELVLALTSDIETVVTDGVHDEYLAVLDAMDEVITPSLELLGVEIGSADVWATSADCAFRRLAPVSVD